MPYAGKVDNLKLTCFGNWVFPLKKNGQKKVNGVRMVSPDEPLEDAALGTGDELVIFVERWQMLAVPGPLASRCS